MLLAYYGWLDGKIGLLYACLTFSSVVFRSELVALFGPIALETLLSRKISFPRAFLIGAVAGVLSLRALPFVLFQFNLSCPKTFYFSLVLTIAVDSVMWGRWLWPEGEVLYYNTYLNKSKDWGVSPFYWYFAVAIPKTMMATIAFVPVGIFYERRLLSYLMPTISFVFLYSFLPHKELRFIFYVFPILNLAAATGIVRFFRHIAKGNCFLGVVAVGLLLSSLMFSQGFLYVSHHNYPGGHAFDRLHQLVPASSTVHVHIDVAAAQTGVSRFGQLNSNWVYDKTEDLLSFDQFTHVVTANATVATKTAKFQVLDAVSSFAGIRWIKSFPFVEPKFAEAIYIHKRL